MTLAGPRAFDPEVSIIVPAYNEANNIIACLQALVSQAPIEQDTSLPPTEIIIVDNASTDQTPTLVRQFVARYEAARHQPGPSATGAAATSTTTGTWRPTIRLISEQHKGRGTARATGFAAARGYILLSTDADTTVPSRWVATLAVALSRPGTAAVTGRCRIGDCAPLTNTLFNHIQPLSMGLYRLIFGHWWLTGSNFGITRTTYDSTGGFDPLCRDQEDIDLSRRLHATPTTPPARVRLLPKSATVTTVGDRFRNGLFAGLAEYVRAYIGRFWLRKGNSYIMKD